MTIRRIVPNFQADEPNNSRSFYEDFLGLEIGMNMDWIITFISPNNKTAQLSLIKQDPQAKIHPDCSVEVSNLTELHNRAIKERMNIVYPLTEEPWGVRRFFLKDPSGHVVNLMEHITRAEPN